jgi:hypothetical protein
MSAPASAPKEESWNGVRQEEETSIVFRVQSYGVMFQFVKRGRGINL